MIEVLFVTDTGPGDHKPVKTYVGYEFYKYGEKSVLRFEEYDLPESFKIQDYMYYGFERILISLFEYEKFTDKDNITLFVPENIDMDRVYSVSEDADTPTTLSILKIKHMLDSLGNKLILASMPNQANRFLFYKLREVFKPEVESDDEESE